MTGQLLDRVLKCYRIGDPDGLHPIFDATGSTIYPGRWNDRATPVVYASEHYSTAMLEKLAHGSGRLPPNQHFIEITIPNAVSYEVVTPHSLPRWDDPLGGAARAHVARWVQERRSAILLVPSIVARIERNIVINPAHPEFRKISHGLHEPVWWDERLFGAGEID